MSGAVLVPAALAALAAWLWAGAGRSSARVSVAGRSPEPVSGMASGWLTRWRAARQPAAVLALLNGLVAELATGQPTGQALEQASRGLQPNPCPRACHAAVNGGNVAAALRLDAARPGAHALRNLAACWEVAERSGAGLALAVSRLADGVRATEQARAQLDAEVAAARTSAHLLAALPLFGLLIGHWIGAEPLTWLLASWIGRGVLLAGVLLQLIGLAWLRRMVTSVEGIL